MLQNYESQRRVSFYADKLCVTPKNLAKVVKGVTGHSVQEWINEVVVIEAKRCLKTSDMSVFQISERLHFTTPSSFVMNINGFSFLTFFIATKIAIMLR